MDRDTTSTPYKASPDGLVYFRYPNGDAEVVTAADYTALRAMGSGDTSTGRVAVTGQYIAGAFVFSDTDPFGAGDEGGVCIAATDGWWVRVFTAGVVKLDWWATQEDQDYTALIQRIADTNGISTLTLFDMQVPTGFNRGLLDRVDISQATAYIRNSSGNNFTFKQTIASDLTEWRQWVFTGVVSLTTDPGIILEGRKDLNAVDRTGDQKGLLEATYFADAVVTLRHNTNWPICGSMAFVGNSPGSTTVIEGVHQGGGIERISNAILGSLHVQCEINDPECLSMGVDVNDPESGSKQGFYKGVAIVPNTWRRITGHLKSRYGMMCYGGTGGLQDGMGVSESDPFILEKIDGGYNDKDEFVDAFGVLFLQGIQKNDGIHNGTSPCYMRMVFTNKFRGENLFFIETTPDSIGETKTFQYQYTEVVNNTTSGLLTYRGIGNAAGAEAAPPVSFRQNHNVYTGEWPTLSIKDGPNTINNVTVSGMSDSGTLYTNTGFSASCEVDSVPVAWDGPVEVDGLHHTARGLTNKKPVISVSSGGVLNLRNLSVESAIGVTDYMWIGSAAEGSFPITVNLISHSLPSGTEFKEAAGAVNSPVFQLDGVVTPLPYTVP